MSLFFCGWRRCWHLTSSVGNTCLSIQSRTDYGRSHLDVTFFVSHTAYASFTPVLSGIRSWSECFMCSRTSYKKHSSGHPRLRIINVTLCGRVHVGWVMVRDAMQQILCSALSVYFVSFHNTQTHYLPQQSPQILHTCSGSSVTTSAHSYYNRLRFQR
jgi:hypothetical protein